MVVSRGDERWWSVGGNEGVVVSRGRQGGSGQ